MSALTTEAGKYTRVHDPTAQSLHPSTIVCSALLPVNRLAVQWSLQQSERQPGILFAPPSSAQFLVAPNPLGGGGRAGADREALGTTEKVLAGLGLPSFLRLLGLSASQDSDRGINNFCPPPKPLVVLLVSRAQARG